MIYEGDDQVCWEEGLVGCLRQSHDKLSEADIFVAFVSCKDPIDFKKIDLNLTILNLVRALCSLSLVQLSVYFLLIDDRRLLSDDL